MKLSVRAILSLVFGFGGVAMLAIGLSRILDTGTCASGGPYAIARACPKGSGVWGILLPLGLFVWLLGVFVSKEGLVRPGTGQVVWTVGFAGGGIALLLKAFTQTSLGPGSNLGIFIMAAIFIPMGFAIWIPWLIRFVRARRTGPVEPPPPSVAAVSGNALRRAGQRPAAGERKARAEQLNRLRSGGALTRAEFDQLKRDPVGSGEPSADRLGLIGQLAELKASGILTPEEFEAKKRAVMLGAADRSGEAAR
jgi:hypothetical protein